MNRIQDMIKKLCPNGVKWVKLGDVCEFQRGNNVQKTDFVESGVGCIHYGQIYTHYKLSATQTNKFVSKEVASKAPKAHTNDVVITITSENVEDLCKPVAWLGLEDIAVSSHALIIRHKQNAKFLANLFVSNCIGEQKPKYAHSGKVTEIKPEHVAKFIIPLPSLEVQQSIVDVLDKFEAMRNNLNAELALRRKQYEHFREKLLTFGDDVERVKLGDVCTFIRGPFGGALKKEIFVESGIAVYEQQNAIYGNLKFRYFITDEKFKEMKRFCVCKGDIIMSCSGTMGKTFIIPEDAPQGVINQALLILRSNNILFNEYLKKIMDSTLFKTILSQNTQGGAIQNVASVPTLKNLSIPLPTLEVQQSIVAKLDKFEALISNIERELELRTRQYEYYREKLLTF